MSGIQLMFAAAALGLDLNAAPTVAGTEVPDAPKEAGASSQSLETLEAMLDTPLTIASSKPMSIRESPGIISVLTREDIMNSGARDLLDVIRLIPGFDTMMHVDAQVSYGFRGIWDKGGGVAFMIDGQPLNEHMYGVVVLGNHYPVDTIDSIEVIRGPGSVQYGGFAEYAVVNIRTRAAADLQGISVSGQGSRMPSAWGRGTGTLSYGQRVSDDLDLRLDVFSGAARRSDTTYTDIYGHSIDLTNNSWLDPLWINAGARYGDLNVRFIYDNYRTKSVDGFDQLIPRDDQNFISYMGEARYGLRLLGDKLLVEPSVRYIRNEPWRDTDPTKALYYLRVFDQYLAETKAKMDVVDWLNVMLGTSYNFDKSYNSSPLQQGLGGLLTDARYLPDIHAYKIAAYGEVLATTPWGALVAGARYEHHSRYGDSFVPRFGYTKVLGDFHFKLLYANAFKAPAVMNFLLNPDIKPEKVRDVEAQVAWSITERHYLALTGFDNLASSIIIYQYKDGEFYVNGDKMGTRGIEAEYRMRYDWGTVSASYSFYTAKGKPRPDDFMVPDNSSQMMGYAPHRGTLYSSFKIHDGLTFNPSLIAIGSRYAYTHFDASGNLADESGSRRPSW